MRKGHQPQTNILGGEGHDSNNVTTPKTSRIVSTNTKRGCISLSIPTCLHGARAQSMEKEETRKHNQGTASAGVARVGNCPKKEDVDRRLATIVKVYNWQRLPPERHLINNLEKQIQQRKSHAEGCKTAQK